ncbi:MAG: hypothetical protein GY847_17600, partial [Proteobacteria bacterium]|nr:hypothetical protein [Pseudomonadota bacterium]
MTNEENSVKFTSSGIPIELVYTSENGVDLSELGNPGEYPFTRGVHRDGYNGKLWT